MVEYKLIFPILISFFVTLFLLPYWIEKAKKFGFVGKDMNKYDKKEVAEAGGIVAMAGFLLGILLYVAIETFSLKSTAHLIEIFALICSMLMLSLIGLIDGLLGWRMGLRRRFRLFACVFAAIPLIVINVGHDTIALPFIGLVNLGLIYPIFLVPLGIVATSVTFNFLAGFNGLEAGQGIILIGALSLVAYLTGSSWLAIIGLCMVVSLLAFLFYNFFPAKVFPGDTITYPVGGMIAVMAIIGNFEKIAVFFFIPYILEVILKIRGKLVKQSFGKPMKDGSLDMKYSKIYGLENLSIYLMKKAGITPTEKKVVYSIWLFQTLIVALGFIIFWKGIFG